MPNLQSPDFKRGCKLIRASDRTTQMQCSTEGDLGEPEEHEKWSAEKRRTDWEDLYKPCVQDWTACCTEKPASSLLQRNASQVQGCQHATPHSFLIQDFFPLLYASWGPAGWEITCFKMKLLRQLTAHPARLIKSQWPSHTWQQCSWW